MKLNKNYKEPSNQRRFAEHSGGQMQAIKKRLIKERGSRCEWCNRYGDVDCDHITPVEDYGTDRDPYDLEGNGIAMDDDSNLQLLCKECHKEKSAHERMSRGDNTAKHLAGVSKHGLVRGRKVANLRRSIKKDAQASLVQSMIRRGMRQVDVQKELGIKCQSTVSSCANRKLDKNGKSEITKRFEKALEECRDVAQVEIVV